MMAGIDVIAGMAAGNLPMLAAIVVAYVAGTFTPDKYASERLRGFGRAVASKLPYRPPPGMDETEALQEATDDE